MKALRFRKKREAYSATKVSTAKKPNLLQRFVNKTKRTFKPCLPASVTTSRSTPLPEQSQALTPQSSSSVHEDPALASPEWLNANSHPIHAPAPRKTRKINGPAPEAACTSRFSDGASSVYSQLGSDRVDFALPSAKVSNLLESQGTLPTQKTLIRNSHSVSASGGDRTKHGEDGRDKSHTRGLQSLNVANGSFFSTLDVGYQHQKDALPPRALLTDDAEDYSGCLAVVFRTVDESDIGRHETLLVCTANTPHELISEHSFSAQPFEELELLRHFRAIFAARLEAELEIQKASLEAGFEKCYETSDRLHEIDLLNLKDDHEFEVKELREERDARSSEVAELTTHKQDLEGDVHASGAQVSGLESLLEDRTTEAETFQCHAKIFWEENNELISNLGQLRHAVQNCGARNQDVAHAHEMTAKVEQFKSQLSSAVAYRNALQLQITDLARRYEDVCGAYERGLKIGERVERQLAALVDEKSKEFSWHMQENRRHLVLKPEDEEAAESNATAVARELHRRETEKAGVLSDELAELRSTTEAQLKKQAQAILDLSELATANAVALDVSLDEKEVLAKKYKALLTAISVNSDLSELTRGLSYDLRTAFEQRTLFGLAFLEAELQITKSEQKRRSQVCDLRDLLQEKEDHTASLKARLDEAESRSSVQEFILEARDDEIKKTVNELKDRILELEQMMEL